MNPDTRYFLGSFLLLIACFLPLIVSFFRTK